MCCVLRNFKDFITLILFFSELSHWQTCGAEESNISNSLHKAVRQDLGSPIVTVQPGKMAIPQYVGGHFAGGQYGQMLAEGFGKNALRQPEPKKPLMDATKKFKRTTILFESRAHYCEYMARPCMHTYQTGKICARAFAYSYQTFENYCMMEFVNCRENYEIWQMVYVGQCFNIPEVKEYIQYAYHDDFFLDNYYVVDDKIN